MNYKIYSLLCPYSGQIRYIGVTTQSLNGRLSQHIYCGRNSIGTIVSKWIRYLLSRGERPSIKLLENCTEYNWESREIFYIKTFKEAGHKLYNQDKGGRGVVINKKSSSLERTALSKYKKVYQCDDNFNIIKEWESPTIASEVLGISRKSIYKSLQQKENISNKRAGGYRWIYKELYDTGSFLKKELRDKKTFKGYRNVIKRDFLGNQLGLYDSITDCAKDLGMAVHILRRRLSKGRFIHSNGIFEALSINK